MKSKLCKPKYGIKSILTQLNGSGIQIFAWEKAINSNYYLLGKGGLTLKRIQMMFPWGLCPDQASSLTYSALLICLLLPVD